MSQSEGGLGSGSSAPRSNLGRPRPLMPVLLVLLVAAGIGAGAWWLTRAPPAPPPAVEGPAAAAPEADLPQLPPLPAVEVADARVRDALRTLASLAPWLTTEDLARRFVAAVNAIADGRSPRTSLPFLEVKGPFEAAEREGRPVIDPRSYARYDAIARLIGSLDAADAARAFREVSPLLEAAHREIGPPRTTFRAVFARAVAHLLETPAVEGEVGLVEAGAAWQYADPGLEQLSAAQKHLLRLGPENGRRVRTKLREVADAIGLQGLPGR